MDTIRPKDLARAWFAEWPTGNFGSGPVSSFLKTLTDREPERAWPLILTLVECAPDDDILGCVAAGPLEDILCRHGEGFIERVEERAQTDAKFKRCLGGVWGRSAMGNSLYARVREAAGHETF